MSLQQLELIKKTLIISVIILTVLVAVISSFNLINSGGRQLFGIFNTILLLLSLIGIVVLTIVRGQIKDKKSSGSS